MNRIESYPKLTIDIVKWIKDYYFYNNIDTLVVGVSGGIDSAVVSTLCAETGLPTYVITMPLDSKKENTELSNLHAKELGEKYENVEILDIDLSGVFHTLISTIGLQTSKEGYTYNRDLITNEHSNANTKSRLRMVTLYQIAGSVGGIVVGTGNKVEDYGVGFYTKYGDGGVDIAPIADLYKTEVWESRTDEDQLGASYEQLEEAMEHGTGPAVKILGEYNEKNKHKMNPIPTFKL